MKTVRGILKNCKSLAIMGGTFDPIHYGHLVAAETVRHELGVEQVLFIPSGRPPHKKGREISPSEHRYLMTALATAANPYFHVSRIEIDRPDYTYTIDTIKELKTQCRENCKLYFITGADAVQQIFSWKDSGELLSLCEFVAVTRPGNNTGKLESFIESISGMYSNAIHVLEVPALAISSTDIRNRVKIFKTIKYLLPEDVERYIQKFGLYADPLKLPKKLLKLNGYVHTMLSPERFSHTQGVCAEALKLSDAYGEDRAKAAVAALLHDCAKDFKEEKTRRMCKMYDLELDAFMDREIALAHGPLGAKIAKARFGVTDKDVLNAIKYHTTGRPKMSALEKIIYLADYIEEGREYFEGLRELRELSYENLDKAVHLGLVLSEADVRQKGRLIHPLGIDALKYYNN